MGDNLEILNSTKKITDTKSDYKSKITEDFKQLLKSKKETKQAVRDNVADKNKKQLENYNADKANILTEKKDIKIEKSSLNEKPVEVKSQDNKSTENIYDSGNLETFDDIKIIDDNFDDIDMTALVSLLLIVNNKKNLEIDDINVEDFKICAKEFLSGKTIEDIALDGTLDSMSVKKEQLFKIKDFLGNIVDNMESVEAVKEQIVLNNMSPAKDNIIKALNSKGLTDEEIKMFNMILKAKNILADDNKVTSISEGIKLDIISESDIIKNTQSSSEFLSNSDDSTSDKDDEFLSRILLDDKSKDSFDLGMQRLKTFSVVSEPKVEQSISKFTIKTDIANFVSNMTKSNIKELVVKVNPGNLGEVSIKLVSDSDNMKAIIKFSSKETYAFINTQDIKQHLTTENIKISDVEISLYKEDATFSNGESSFEQEGFDRKYQNSQNEDYKISNIDEAVDEELGISSLDIII